MAEQTETNQKILTYLGSRAVPLCNDVSVLEGNEANWVFQASLPAGRTV